MIDKFIDYLYGRNDYFNLKYSKAKFGFFAIYLKNLLASVLIATLLSAVLFLGFTVAILLVIIFIKIGDFFYLFIPFIERSSFYMLYITFIILLYFTYIFTQQTIEMNKKDIDNERY